MEVYVLVDKQKSLFQKTMTLACFLVGAMSMMYVLMGYIVFFPMAFLTWTAAYILRNRDYEYEYSYYGGELRFARIVNKKRRKELKGYMMEEVLVIAPLNDNSVYQYMNDKNVKVRDLTTGNPNGKVYVAVVKNAKETEIVKYEPDEKYLDEVCVKYGHKVKR